MAYYLGRDVSVWLTTEDVTNSVQQNGTSSLISINSGAPAAVKVEDGTAHATFALKLHADSVQAGDALSDITGVDVGIGVTDEDITYMGQRSVLKAEIKKETTVTLTRKKKGPLWDLIFNGPAEGSGSIDSDYAGAVRWGLTNGKMSDGLRAPKDHTDGGSNVTFGYRVHVQLSSSETISIPGCQVTGHSVTLNADGTTEETMEFMSNATPFFGATPNVSDRLTSALI